MYTRTVLLFSICASSPHHAGGHSSVSTQMNGPESSEGSRSMFSRTHFRPGQRQNFWCAYLPTRDQASGTVRHIYPLPRAEAAREIVIFVVLLRLEEHADGHGAHCGVAPAVEPQLTKRTEACEADQAQSRGAEETIRGQTDRIL